MMKPLFVALLCATVIGITMVQAQTGGPPAQSRKTFERKLFDFDGRDGSSSRRVPRRGHHGPRPPDRTTKQPRRSKHLQQLQLTLARTGARPARA